MFLIADKSSGNFLSSDEEHSYTNHIGNALVIEDEADARAQLKGARKVLKGAPLILLQIVEDA